MGREKQILEFGYKRSLEESHEIQEDKHPECDVLACVLKSRRRRYPKEHSFIWVKAYCRRRSGFTSTD